MRSSHHDARAFMGRRALIWVMVPVFFRNWMLLFLVHAAGVASLLVSLLRFYLYKWLCLSVRFPYRKVPVRHLRS